MLIGPTLLAHGVGGRTDLPVPGWMVGYGAAAALVVSFAALAVFWRAPRLERAADGPVVAGGGPTSTVTLAVLRALGVVFFALAVATALFGVDDALRNLAPITIYVVFWVGLTLVSALVGDAYALLDPYETITAPVDGDGSYRLGNWPAAAGLFGFVWLELVYSEGSRPRVLGVAVILLTAAMVAGCARFGRPFLEQGNPFRAWFGLLSEMAPLGADGRGRVRLRWPLAGLARTRPVPGRLALVMVALGSTAFDGLTRTTWWSDVSSGLDEPLSSAVGTLGLLAAIAVVAGLYLAAMRFAASTTARSARELADAFVHSLVPIAFGYAVAHYLSLLVFEGQAFWALLSDPFGRGWDLFGTAHRTIDFTVLAPRTVSWVQVAAIVLGHVAGVVLAHDRALVLFPGRQATRSQYPLLVVMVLFTVGGLALLLGG